MVKKMAAIAAATMLGMSGAIAADLGGSAKDDFDKPNATWTGCSLGLGLGTTISDTEVGVFGISISGLSGSGYNASVQAGCDYQVERMVLGLFGGYEWTDAEFAITGFGGGVGIGLDDGYYIGARAGVALSASTLVYAMAGWQNYSMSNNIGLSLPDLEGLFVGGGFEYRLTTNISIGAEYKYSMMEAVAIAPVTFESDVHTVKGTLSYRFNTGLGR